MVALVVANIRLALKRMSMELFLEGGGGGLRVV